MTAYENPGGRRRSDKKVINADGLFVRKMREVGTNLEKKYNKKYTDRELTRLIAQNADWEELFSPIGTSEELYMRKKRKRQQQSGDFGFGFLR